ncbi:ABC transporter ATP-binding protein [Tessaracoccus sp. Y1736]
MRGLAATVDDVRAAFTLVPWRLRPKLIAMFLGLGMVALIDMSAVVLVLPAMQIITGTPIASAPALYFLSNLTGITQPEDLLVFTLSAVIVLMITKSVLTIAFRWWSLGILATARTDATHEAMMLYMTSPWVHHRRRPSDDIFQTLLTYIPSVFASLTPAFLSLFVSGVTVGAILVALLLLSPLATLAAVIVFGGSAFAIQETLRSRILKLAEQARVEQHKSWHYLSPALDGSRDIRLTNSHDFFTEGYSKTTRRIAELGRRTGVLNELPKHLLEIVMILGIILVALLLLATSPRDEAFAFLGVFAVAAIRIIPQLNAVVATVGGIRSNSPNAARLREEIANLQNEEGRARDPEPRISFTREAIVFDGVTFRFPDSVEPVLRGVSGEIPYGSTVALVGASGAGKTTFVEILLGLLRPASGSIMVGDSSIHDSPTAWREQVGVVTQDIYLMDRSLRENIAFGVPADRISDERVVSAIHRAQLTDFFESLPDGLDTVIRGGGTRVSGGQKQRIGIARALYRDPSVLVLDEATSALDNETEHRVTQALADLKGAMTIIVVAHRLSTVRDADIIFYFVGGRIEAEGTMAELVHTSPGFAELVRLGRLA